MTPLEGEKKGDMRVDLEERKSMKKKAVLQTTKEAGYQQKNCHHKNTDYLVVREMEN